MSDSDWIYLAAIVLFAVGTYAVFYYWTRGVARTLRPEAAAVGGQAPQQQGVASTAAGPPYSTSGVGERYTAEPATPANLSYPRVDAGKPRRDIDEEDDTYAGYAERAAPTGPPYPIDQLLRISYSSKVYLAHTFGVEVEIAPSGKLPPPPKDFDGLPPEPLHFKAKEPEPTIQVELKFAEGCFSANRTQITQKLSATTGAKFSFQLKALKAEDCTLTAVISYLSQGVVPSRVVQQVVTDTIGGTGPGEHTVQAISTPATTTQLIEELVAHDLVIHVEEVLGLGGTTLALSPKLAAGLVAVVTVLAQVLLKPSDAPKGWAGAIGFVLTALVGFIAPAIGIATAGGGKAADDGGGKKSG